MNADDPSDLERLAVEIVPFEPEHAGGFAALVVDTLRGFGFEPDAELDRDLDDLSGLTPHSGSRLPEASL